MKLLILCLHTITQSYKYKTDFLVLYQSIACLLQAVYIATRVVFSLPDRKNSQFSHVSLHIFPMRTHQSIDIQYIKLQPIRISVKFTCNHFTFIHQWISVEL